MQAGVLQLFRWGLLERLVSAGTPSIASAQFHYGTAPVPSLDPPGGGRPCPVRRAS